jgi:hypothetical protein
MLAKNPRTVLRIKINDMLINFERQNIVDMCNGVYTETASWPEYEAVTDAVQAWFGRLAPNYILNAESRLVPLPES